jgi:hypothetical protein
MPVEAGSSYRRSNRGQVYTGSLARDIVSRFLSGPPNNLQSIAAENLPRIRHRCDLSYSSKVK